MKNKRPRVGWNNYDRCKSEALKYNNSHDFKLYSVSAYKISLKNRWFDEITSHFTQKVKRRNYWTHERCEEVAFKYKDIKEFKNNDLVVYNKILENKWDDLLYHFDMSNFRGYWCDYEKCKEEALKYSIVADFRKNSYNAYRSIKKNKWDNELMSHMKKYKVWTYEKCKKEALKYTTRNEFSKAHGWAYHIIISNSWDSEIFSHMEVVGNKYRRLIYAYEFEDNHVYVGLTYNINNRNWRHINDERSPVYKHIEKTKIQPNLIKISDYLEVDEAIKLELSTVEKYKNEGWIVLNKAKAGVLGSNQIKWTYKKCKEEILKYNSLTEFKKSSWNAYNSAKKNGWLEEFYPKNN